MTKEDNEKVEYKIQRRLKQKKMERNVRKGKIGLSRFRVFLRIVSIIFLIFLGYEVLTFSGWYINKSIFNTPENRYLKIYNNRITPDYKVLTALRQTEIPNHPIYRVNPKIFEENVETLDPVKNVIVKRYFYPARLEVYVEERKPIFTISPSAETPDVAFFTDDAKLIGRDYLPLPVDIKTYKVLTYGNKGDDYREWDKEKVLNIYRLAKFIEQEINKKLLYIDMRNPADIYIQSEDVKIRVGELNNTLFDRIKDVASIYGSTKDIDQPVKYIDLSWESTQFIKIDASQKIEEKTDSNVIE